MDKNIDVADLVNQIAEQQKCMHKLLGDRRFDVMSLGQSMRLRRKLESGRFDKLQHVCVAFNLRHAVPVNPERHYTHLGADFLEGDLGALPDNCTYLLLNNDIGKHLNRFRALMAARPNCLFVVWDWDSQHWLHMSCHLAAQSDFYAPATSENLYTLSNFTPHIVGPIAIGVNQWSRAFIVEHMPLLLEDRSNDAFGPHVRYPDFERRNRAIATINQKLPGIRFADDSYKKKSDLDNLRDWAGYKTHWIIPVLGGVPIRVFNCILTGGIALLPSFARHMPESLAFDEEPLYYDVLDLVEPEKLQALAVARFDQEGQVGVVRRVGKALESQHIDTRCEQLLCSVESAIQRLAGRAMPSERYPMAEAFPGRR